MSFTPKLWEAISKEYKAITEHSFVKELGQGTLSRERFVFYLQQDALYLVDFSRALSLIAARLEQPRQIETVLSFANECLVAERCLHQEYFAGFDVLPAKEMSPTCAAYTHFLLAKASTANIAEAMAAVLPCFWIYQQVGRFISEQANENNAYQSWIDLYSGEAFAESVSKAINLTDELAKDATKATELAMIKAFVHATRLEWTFWDSAYRLESWSFSQGS